MESARHRSLKVQQNIIIKYKTWIHVRHRRRCGLNARLTPRDCCHLLDVETNHSKAVLLDGEVTMLNHRCQPSRNRAGNSAFLHISRIPAFFPERPAFLGLS